MQQTVTVEVTEYIDAAHHLPDSNGLTTKKCLNLHGHTYGVKVKVEANYLIDNFVVDYGTLKSIINELDHAAIVWDQDVALLSYVETTASKHVTIPYVPTAENIAKYLYESFTDKLPRNCRVLFISVQEGTKPGKSGWVNYYETNT